MAVKLGLGSSGDINQWEGGRRAFQRSDMDRSMLWPISDTEQGVVFSKDQMWVKLKNYFVSLKFLLKKARFCFSNTSLLSSPLPPKGKKKKKKTYKLDHLSFYP